MVCTIKKILIITRPASASHYCDFFARERHAEYQVRLCSIAKKIQNEHYN
jgi:hypothetical protein